MTEYEYAIRVQRGYQLANLVALVARLREPGRYPGANGNLELTTGELGLFDAAEAELQLKRASRQGDVATPITSLLSVILDAASRTD